MAVDKELKQPIRQQSISSPMFVQFFEEIRRFDCFCQSSVMDWRPFTIISRTGVRSIRFFNMSMMSGCSLAPSMNSSRVISPLGSEVSRCYSSEHTDWVQTIRTDQTKNRTSGWSLPSPFTSILSNMSSTISSGSMSLFRVMSWMACRGRQKLPAEITGSNRQRKT